ncbi:cytoplasmic trna 2-thiolation protein 1 [Phaffia rhodozyma]|uniref:Cytoplasmic tRNA 2-thiolation protein 1 n=1 Tax=Phaffia rhodozyma TaxID=264483 RepID=A0A0F7SGQ5_PHARH|nr:cytoplasmic trna 2-thiolation protein 1 [Phaffia rhodozyma]
MPPRTCQLCQTARAILKRPKTSQQVCKACFFYVFEEEIHRTIVQAKLFNRGDKVAIGASGGKDSTVLAHVMKTLNDRYDYGLDLFLLSIDEGITGYRDDSLKTVKRNQQQYDLPLKILSYDELYGWTMDRIVSTIGKKNNCTFCGVFRRQALDRGAAQLGVDHIVTGHNADDIAETVLMNIMRGDIARLGRCTDIVTKGEDTIKRSKPFKYTYEKEIVMYAYFKRLDYFSTECIYSPEAYRGHARTFLKDLEAVRPSSIIDIIKSGEELVLDTEIRKGMKLQQTCLRCGYISSNDLCKACALLEGLESGLSNGAMHASQDVKKVSNSTDAASSSGETVAIIGEAPKGQRVIPFFERRPTKPAVGIEVEGLEQSVKDLRVNEGLRTSALELEPGSNAVGRAVESI